MQKIRAICALELEAINPCLRSWHGQCMQIPLKTSWRAAPQYLRWRNIKRKRQNSSAAAQLSLAAPTVLVSPTNARKGRSQSSRRASPANRWRNDTVPYANTIDTSATYAARALPARMRAPSRPPPHSSDSRRKIVSPHVGAADIGSIRRKERPQLVQT